MGKVKKDHSRAARRGAGTPPPKDLASMPRAESPSAAKAKVDSAIQRLGVSPGSGIKKRQKKLTHNQKKRKEKGQDRAEAVLEKLAKKVEGGVKRYEKTNERRAGWEKLNEKIEIEVGKMEVELKEGKVVMKE